MAKEPNYMRPTHQSQRRAKNRTTIDCSRCNRCNHCDHGRAEVSDNRSIQLPSIADTPNLHNNGHGNDEPPLDQILTTNATPAELPATLTADAPELHQAESDPMQAVGSPQPMEENLELSSSDNSSMASADSGSGMGTIWYGHSQDGRRAIHVGGRDRPLQDGQHPLDAVPIPFRLGQPRRT